MLIWATALVCLVLVAPLTVVDVPPLLDYPNHLARAVVLAAGSSDPILSSMYAPRWAIIPNLGTDIILPPLLQLFAVHVAGRIVIGLAILLPVVGTLVYNYTIFGARSAWPLASALVAYNATLLLGFLNFVIGLGLALLLAAAWIAWRDRYSRRTVMLAAIGATALFFCHLMGLVCFFLLIAGYELERLWNEPRAVLGRCLAILVVFAVPVCLYLASPLAPVADKAVFSSPIDKLRQLILPFSNYSLPLDIVTASAVALFLGASLAWRRCRITVGGGVTLLLTALLFIVAPWAAKGTYCLETRFVIMLGFLLFGAVRPTGLPRLATTGIIAGFAGLLLVRMTVVGYVWHEHQRDLSALRDVIASVQPGSRVLEIDVPSSGAPQYWRDVPLSRRLSFGFDLDAHLPALLLIEHRAYWPFLFDDPSQQPIETLPPFRALAQHAAAIADFRQLAVPGKADLCGYDHLLLLNAGGAPDLAQHAADRLSPVASSDIAVLFRVRRAACPF